MSTFDLFVQWLVIFGLIGVMVCMGLWVCEQLDRRDDEDWWGR